jgi:hypothetical protein
MNPIIFFNLGDGKTQGWCVRQGDQVNFIGALAGRSMLNIRLDEVRAAAAREFGEQFVDAEYIGSVDAYGNGFPPCWGREI